MYDDDEIKQAVRERYAGHAAQGGAEQDGCCSAGSAPSDGGGCGQPSTSREIGYSDDELAALPDGADLSLGCGNPLAMLELREGETVLDLGSGGGIDCFLAAKRVGPTGRVIGVDMTAEMIDRARANAKQGGYGNVEFRLGEIEHLPVADGSIDAIVSNCVVNLVPGKRQVFGEAFRVLKPGGRLSVSDIVVLAEMPDYVRESVESYVACLAGAVLRDDYLEMIADAGFTDVRVTGEQSFGPDDVVTRDMAEEFKARTGVDDEELRRIAALFRSVRVSARKPQAA